jgi:hypothetical protein
MGVKDSRGDEWARAAAGGGSQGSRGKSDGMARLYVISGCEVKVHLVQSPTAIR